MYSGGASAFGGGTYGEPGASQFAGGGFMQSPAGAAGGGGYGDNAGTSFSPGTGRRAGGNNALLPLTVKHMSSALAKSSGDEIFMVDGQEVNNVTLLGRILHKEEKATDVTFKLDDGTGVVEIKKWNDGDGSGDTTETEYIQVGNYVRVYGHLRSFQNRRTVVAFAIRPIVDYNEVTFHYLECIWVHFVNSKNAAPSAGAAQAAGTQGVGGFGSSAQPGSASTTQYMGTNQYAPPSMAGGGDGVPDLHKKILGIFEDPNNRQREEGLSLDTVGSRIPGYTVQQIRDAVLFLVEEGHLYSTIDEFHYKSTNA